MREALEECAKQDEGDPAAQMYREYLYNYVGDRLMSYDGEQYAYDALGNPTTYRGKSVSWSKGRQMTGYNGKTFTYDGRGRRITKNNLVFSYTNDGKLIKQSNGIEFIYDNSGVVGINYNGIIYVYRKNIFGDIVNLLDNSGNIVVKYEYDSWGNHIVKNADGTVNTSEDFIGNLNPIRYRGYYYDSDINLYYLKTRYYDPETGRFVTIDDVKFIAPNTINGLNLYAYCGNNPVMRTDSQGNSFINFFTGFLGFLIIGAIILAGAIFVLLNTEMTFDFVPFDFQYKIKDNGDFEDLEGLDGIGLSFSLLSIKRTTKIFGFTVAENIISIGKVEAKLGIKFTDKEGGFILQGITLSALEGSFGTKLLNVNVDISETLGSLPNISFRYYEDYVELSIPISWRIFGFTFKIILPRLGR